MSVRRISKRRRSLLVGVAVMAVGAGGGNAVAGTHSAACTAGVHTVSGAKVRTFCGPARGTAKGGGKTFTFSGGRCAVSQGFFTVNIGSITLPPAKPKFVYLGIDAQPPRAGVHHNQIASWQVPGKGYSILGATVTLSANLKSGTFAGRLLSGGTASGTFSCS